MGGMFAPRKSKDSHSVVCGVEYLETRFSLMSISIGFGFGTKCKCIVEFSVVPWVRKSTDNNM